jgi:hypothetical protein
MVFCSMCIRHRRPSNLYEDDNTFFISAVYAINVPRSNQPMPTDASTGMTTTWLIQREDGGIG